MSSLLIIIDAWSYWPKEMQVEKTMHRIINFAKNEEVTGVALATYGIPGCVERDEPFFSNSQKIFCDETKMDTLRQQWLNYKPTFNNNTHELIANMELHKNQLGFIALDPLEILFYCNCVNTSIQNIYVTGFVYERCVRDRPVGIIELNNCNQSNMFINKQNIFLQTDLVQRQDNKPIEPSKIEWQYIDGNKYLYTDPIPWK